MDILMIVLIVLFTLAGLICFGVNFIPFRGKDIDDDEEEEDEEDSDIEDVLSTVTISNYPQGFDIKIVDGNINLVPDDQRSATTMYLQRDNPDDTILTEYVWMECFIKVGEIPLSELEE